METPPVFDCETCVYKDALRADIAQFRVGVEKILTNRLLSSTLRTMYINSLEITDHALIEEPALCLLGEACAVPENLAVLSPSDIALRAFTANQQLRTEGKIKLKLPDIWYRD